MFRFCFAFTFVLCAERFLFIYFVCGLMIRGGYCYSLCEKLLVVCVNFVFFAGLRLCSNLDCHVTFSVTTLRSMKRLSVCE